MASQWSWKGLRQRRGKGRTSSSSSRGNSEAAPVTEFASSSEPKFVWLLRALGPVGGRGRPRRPGAPPGRRCRRARAPPMPASSRSSLSGRQRSSWSQSVTKSAVGGRHRQRPLEVAVEAEARGHSDEREARVPVDLPLPARSSALGSRAVVADHADPVAVGLRADRVELAAQQLGRRVEGRHADRDPAARAPRREAGDGRGRRRGGRRERAGPRRSRSAPRGLR